MVSLLEYLPVITSGLLIMGFTDVIYEQKELKNSK